MAEKGATVDVRHAAKYNSDQIKPSERHVFIELDGEDICLPVRILDLFPYRLALREQVEIIRAAGF
jgi:hypothetical protein